MRSSNSAALERPGGGGGGMGMTRGRGRWCGERGINRMAEERLKPLEESSFVKLVLPSLPLLPHSPEITLLCSQSHQLQRENMGKKRADDKDLPLFRFSPPNFSLSTFCSSGWYSIDTVNFGCHNVIGEPHRHVVRSCAGRTETSQGVS
ncbi:hypothetical protein ACFX1Q_041442 [Malus domestica]